MRALLCLALLALLPLLALPMGAQDLAQIRTSPPGRWLATSLAGIQQELARERGALLLALDPQVPEAQAALRVLMAEEALLPLDLRTLVVDPSQPIGLEVRTLHTYPPQAPRWVMLGPAGRVAEGPGLPTVKDVLGAFEAAGCRPRLGVLRDFLLEHPAQLNGVAALLGELKRVGDARTRTSLGNAQPPPGPDRLQLRVGAMVLGADGDDRFVENHALLADAEDEAIWEEYANLLGKRLGDLLPLSTRMSQPLASLIPDCLWASPRLQACAQRLLPEVEAALAARPANAGLWDLWLALNGGGEGRSMAEVLASLTPSPLTPPGAWPPPGIRAALLQDRRGHGDWKAVLELAEPAWKDVMEAAKGDLDGARKLGALSAGVWSDLCEPLLEALVRLNRLADADALVRDWMALSSWRGAATRAQALALDCGEETLLKRWSELLGD